MSIATVRTGVAAAVAVLVVGTLGLAPTGAAAAPTGPATTGTRTLVGAADPGGAEDLAMPPLVTLQAPATLGAGRGIRVSDPAGHVDHRLEAAPSGWLQVAVLDRNTLEVVYDKTYPCTVPAGSTVSAGNAAAAPCAAAVKADFVAHDLTGAHLVIATSQPGYTPPFGVAAALAPIGVVAPRWTASGALAAGTFAAAGVIGGAAGSAWQVASRTQNAEDGSALRLLLLRSNTGRYDLSGPERVPFDTTAPGSDAGHHVIEVGTERLSAAVTSGGFHIAWVDRTAVSTAHLTVGHAFYATGGPSGAAALEDMRARLETLAGADVLVVVSSVGNPLPAPAVVTWPVAKLITRVVDGLEALGSTRQGAYLVLDRTTSLAASYTLIGRSGAGRGLGIEASRRVSEKMPASGNATALMGLIGRGHDWRLEVDSTSPGGEGGQLAAAALVHADPTPWPDAGNPARRAALAWVGEQVGLGPDPRAQYWRLAYSKTLWDHKRDDLNALVIPAEPGEGVSHDDAVAARASLVKEIGWVEQTYAYFELAAKPYSSIGLTSWAEMVEAANTIKDAVQIPGSVKVFHDVEKIATAILELAEAVPFKHIGHAVHAAMAIYNLVWEIAEVANGEPAESTYQTTVDHLGVSIAERLEAGQDVIAVQLPRVIVADPAKLELVGTCAGLDPGCTAAGGQPSDWTFTPEGLKEGATALKESIKASVYETLLPARYQAYRLPMGQRLTGSQLLCPSNVIDWIGGTKPWESAPNTAYSARRVFHPQQYGGFGMIDLLALGYKADEGKVAKVMHVPTAAATDPVFLPQPRGLGLSSEAFFARAWPSPIDARKDMACHYDDQPIPLFTSPRPRRDLGKPDQGILSMDLLIVNDTARPMWVNGDPLPDGQSVHVREEGRGSNQVGARISFVGPDDRQAEMLVASNPWVGTPVFDRGVGDVFRRSFPLTEGQTRFANGYLDQAYQSDGRPYNVVFHRDQDDSDFKHMTAMYTQRASAALLPGVVGSNPPGRRTAVVSGWPVGRRTVSPGRTGWGAMRASVTVTPASGRRGVVQLQTCTRRAGAWRCTWIPYRAVTWPRTSRATAAVRLTVPAGGARAYRLVLPRSGRLPAYVSRTLVLQARR